MNKRIKGFAPIVFEDSEVLLLGTLPGAVSLKKEYYYADEGNYFWEFFSEYSGYDKPKSNEEVVTILKDLKVALWDIYDSALREDGAHKSTSKDCDIVDEEWNDICRFLQTYPNIKRVGVLGKKAYQEFIRKYPDIITKEDKKDWMAALLEVNFAPHWSIWGSDMYNHGSTKMHYYNVGVSYTKGRTRLAAGYGRYKDGFICSGGVCRQIPQYTGANFSITTSF